MTPMRFQIDISKKVMITVLPESHLAKPQTPLYSKPYESMCSTGTECPVGVPKVIVANAIAERAECDIF